MVQTCFSGAFGPHAGQLLRCILLATGVLGLWPQAEAASLTLLTPAAHRYVRPGDTIQVRLDVSDLEVAVNACQAMLGYSDTYFLPPLAGTVSAGGGVWDDLIWDSWRDSTGLPGEIDTAIGLDAQGAVGTTSNGTVAVISLIAGSNEGITNLVFRTTPSFDPGLVRTTMLSDLQANPVFPQTTASGPIVIDGTAPSVAVSAAAQSNSNVLDGAARSLQGSVLITVQASDALAGLAGAPALVLRQGLQTIALATADTVAPFRYAWVIDAMTSNGRWDIEATAADRSGNTATDLAHFLVVNKNRLTGQVALEGFIGTGTNPLHARSATFVASTATVNATWTVTLVNVTGATFDYVLEDAPDQVTSLSAKTAWSLRRKLPAIPGANGQTAVDFLGGNRVRAGDLTNDNLVTVADYNLLRTRWLQVATAEDINGDGVANVSDYNLLRTNWLQAGDAL